MAWFELDERGRALDRALAFSDGVFAIAITLLVLAFRLPILHGARLNHRLLDALLHQGHLLIGFVVSFFVIARLWMTHHRLSVILRRVDSRFLGLNLVFLGFVVFLPFPAEVVGLYGGTTTAIVFYAATMVVTFAMSAAVWAYAFQYGLVDERVSPLTLRGALVRTALVGGVFLLSIPVAFVAPQNAQFVWLLLAFQRPVLQRLGAAERRPVRRDAPGG